MSYHYSATISISREGFDDLTIEVEGIYYRGCRGVKAHPMDRFAPPDDPAGVEIVSATFCPDPFEATEGYPFSPGDEVELTKKELDQAEEAIFEGVRDAQEAAQEDRADREREEY